MATLEPRQIETWEVMIWIKETFDLIFRRFILFSVTIFSYCVLVYFAIQSVVSVTFYVPIVYLSIGFLLFTSFLLYFVLANLVIAAYCADKSLSLSFSKLMAALVPEQRTLFRMAFSALVVGSSIWILSLSLDPKMTVIAGSERVIEKMIERQEAPYEYIFQLTAGTLYFLLLSLYALRIFFSLPLVLFHELSYEEARALSQRAIVMNVKPMSLVLMLWASVLLGTAIGPNVLSVLFFPMMGVFVYVGYRHIFLGQLRNERPRKVVAESVSPVTVDVKK